MAHKGKLTSGISIAEDLLRTLIERVEVLVKRWYRIMAILLSFTMTACGAGLQTYAGERLPPNQVAILHGLTASGTYAVGAAWSAELVSFDGSKIKRPDNFTVEMLPGAHKVLIESTWSNNFLDKSEISFIAEAGKKYLIGIYELKPGQEPSTADFHERSSAYQFGRAAASGAAQGTFEGLLPVIIIFGSPLLLYLALQKAPEPPKSRPFENCCFVWIHDEQTAEVIAGTAPTAQRRK
jgi:hypothetical protein